jgi:hypothetical protein
VVAATNDRALAVSRWIAGGITRVGAAQKAQLELMGKHHGLFTERRVHEFTNIAELLAEGLARADEEDNAEGAALTTNLWPPRHPLLLVDRSGGRRDSQTQENAPASLQRLRRGHRSEDRTYPDRTYPVPSLPGSRQQCIRRMLM